MNLTTYTIKIACVNRLGPSHHSGKAVRRHSEALAKKLENHKTHTSALTQSYSRCMENLQRNTSPLPLNQDFSEVTPKFHCSGTHGLRRHDGHRQARSVTDITRSANFTMAWQCLHNSGRCLQAISSPYPNVVQKEQMLHTP